MNNLSLLVVCLCAIAIGANAYYTPEKLANAQSHSRFSTESFRSGDIPKYTQTEAFFDGQTLDHFNPFNKVNFSQRYFEINDFWKSPDGPIIFHLCGEYTCQGIFDFRLFPVQLASEFGAKIVTLEHRFWGKSLPFGNDSSAEHYQYLTVPQALADLASFTEWYQTTIINAPAGKTTNNKWFIMGGSYPGAMSGWYRLKYPHLSIGALSSSGVVNSILEYTAFDEQVLASALLSSDACGAAIQEATKQVEAALPNIKSRFNAEALSDGDFFYFIADSVAEGIQYGHREVVCEHFANQAPLEALVNYTNNFFVKEMGSTPGDYNTDTMASPSYNRKSSPVYLLSNEPR